MTEDTNTLIDISSRDPYMRSLAADINEQLRKLRNERRRYQQGDRELKEAVMNISHDLRTPLTAIYGYLSLLDREEKSMQEKGIRPEIHIPESSVYRELDASALGRIFSNIISNALNKEAESPDKHWTFSFFSAGDERIEHTSYSLETR